MVITESEVLCSKSDSVKEKRSHKVKLIIGLISKEEFLPKAEKYLRQKFADIDFESKILAFDYTTYYQKEFGVCLKRKFLSFKRLIKVEELAKVKLITNIIEKRLSVCGKRRVNIDPGYIDESKLVLATHKDFSHRICLREGIFAEVTLYFSKGNFYPWPWTYPDYRTTDYIEIFNKIRGMYIEQIKPQ